MSQHDYNLDNQSGAAFRGDLNAALQAILTNNSGATEPAVMAAYQWWADTTAGILKRRNAANTAWVSVAPLAGLTVSRVLVTDASGAQATSSVTPTELSRLSGILSNALGSTDTQNVSGKTFLDPVTIAEIATPATPASGFGRIYFKADGFLYQQNDDGTETRVGAGSGGFNLSSNPDFESSTSGYAAYADLAGAVSVDGTGGSPTLTITRTTTLPLTGTASGLITKDAANRQGNGISSDFTVPLSMRGGVARLDYDYTVNSGTYVTGDVTMWFFDVTNSTVIQPSGSSVQAVGTGLSIKQVCQVQIPINCTTLRVCWHVSTVSALAYALKIDNVSFGPQIITQGTPVSDPTAYSPTFTGFGSPTAIDVKSWRMGAVLKIQGKFTLGTTTATEARITLGFQGGNANVTASSSATGTQLAGTYARGGVATTHGGLVLWQPGLNYLVLTDAGVLGASSVDSTLAALGTGIGSSGAVVEFNAEIPISGWSSNSQMSSDTDTRVVSFSGASSGTQAVTASVTNYNVVASKDSHNAWTGSTYVIPVPGDYLFSGGFNGGASASTTLIFKNGVSTGRSLCTDQNARATSGAALITNLVAGDIMSLRNDSSVTLVSGGSLSIFRLSGPSQIAASELIKARYTTVAGQSIPNNTATIIDFGTRTYDSHGAVTTGASWKFTAQSAGNYSVVVNAVLASGGGWAAGEQVTLDVFRNGAFYSNVFYRVETGTHTQSVPIGAATDDIDLIAGDFIDVRINQNSGAAISLVTTAGFNHIAIRRNGF